MVCKSAAPANDILGFLSLKSLTTMLSGGILSKRMQGEALGSKRARDASGGSLARQPVYGRSGLLARAADEERVTLAAAHQSKRTRLERAGGTSVPATAELTKFIPSPFVLTPMLVANSITNSTRRLVTDEAEALQAQLRVLQQNAEGKQSETLLEAARRRLAERFVISVMDEGATEVRQVFDEECSKSASEAITAFNALLDEEVRLIQKKLTVVQQQIKSQSIQKEAVAVLPTNYLQGLMHFEHFITSASSEVVKCAVQCAEKAATIESQQFSILPLPIPARQLDGQKTTQLSSTDDAHRQKPPDRPDPNDVAKHHFNQFLVTSIRPIKPEFSRVELPLTLTVRELDAAEQRRHSGGGAPPITGRTYTTLTKSIQIVTLKDDRPIEGVRPIVALQLIGEKYYEGGSRGVTEARNDRHHVRDDPLAAFGFHEDRSMSSSNTLRPKYRFHLLPFPNQGNNAGQQAGIIDTVAVFGRNAEQSSITIEHPSCSGQHFALYWSLAHTKMEASADPSLDSDVQWFMELHVADLGAANGTVLVGGPSPQVLPKAPIDMKLIPPSELNPQSAPLPSAAPIKVLRAACPLKGGSLPADVGYGPLATPSYSLLDGDQIVAGLSTRRYVVVFEESGTEGGTM